MRNQIRLSVAIEGFLLACDARQLSMHTVADYRVTLRRFAAYLSDDPPLTTITRAQVDGFLSSLNQPQPQPGVVPQPPRLLSKKTILNHHTGLSALWSWALTESLVTEHLIQRITRPKPETPVIVPFSESDIRALLKACALSTPYDRPGKVTSEHVPPLGERNRAIILLLLDTGLRASELCNARVADFDQRNRRLTVTGKGDKARILPLSAETVRALWRVLHTEWVSRAADAPLCPSQNGKPLTRLALLSMLARLGKKAGVPNCHPHRFRHTFAVWFLRNGGNVYELQAILGHASLETVKIYLSLAQTDIDAAHKRASPVENWHLR